MSAEGSTAKMNMGGTVIVIILAILLAIVLTVICYAQKKKVSLPINNTSKANRLLSCSEMVLQESNVQEGKNREAQSEFKHIQHARSD